MTRSSPSGTNFAGRPLTVTLPTESPAKSRSKRDSDCVAVARIVTVPSIPCDGADVAYRKSGSEWWTSYPPFPSVGYRRSPIPAAPGDGRSKACADAGAASANAAAETRSNPLMGGQYSVSWRNGEGSRTRRCAPPAAAAIEALRDEPVRVLVTLADVHGIGELPGC